MRQLFADTAFYIALLDPHDQHHAKAKKLAQAESKSLLITSEFVLIEVLSFFSELGAGLRRSTSAFCVKL